MEKYSLAFTIVAELASGFCIGFGLAGLINSLRRTRVESHHSLLLYQLNQQQDVIRMLARRVVEDDIKIKEQRWLLEGGIDEDRDLEDISNAKAGGDGYVEERAQALIAACGSLSLLNKGDSLQRGLESLGKRGLWR